MIFYILNAALILSGCYVFYRLLLQKETFFPLNRWVLLGCLVLSFSLPLLPIPAKYSFREIGWKSSTALMTPFRTDRVTSSNVSGTVPQTQITPSVSAISPVSAPFPIKKVLIWVYWTGVIVFGINFLIQLSTLLFRIYRCPSIRDGRFRIVEISGDRAPCSFGNSIFINPEKYDWETYSQILLHEKVHIEQGHSYDIMLAEICLVFQWFNPFAWMYRKAVENNLEFLTDNELVENKDVERRSYQLSLVRVSAPQFPLTLTTNYNQSILKMRLMMMNAKKSNVHTAWKYLFLAPLLVVFVCLLNDPVAYSKTTGNNDVLRMMGYEKFVNEGYWFATIKNDKIVFRFERGDNDNETSNTTFSLSEFTSLPKNVEGTFQLRRDAGAIDFTGKFEGDAGMGKYIFKPDPSYADFIKDKGISKNDDGGMFAFFMLDVSKKYISMLINEGFKNLEGGEIIAMKALKIDEAYIQSIKKAGYADISAKQLIPLKALDVDVAYIKDLKKSGATISPDRLVALKAQGINGDFLKNSGDLSDVQRKLNPINPNNMNIDGKGDKGNKGSKWSSGDTEGDEFLDQLGQRLAKKIMNVTPEFAKSIRDAGFEATEENLYGMSALGIDAAYLRSLKTAGFPNITGEEAISLKALGVHASEIQSYKALGFSDVGIEEVLAARALGVTPEYIKGLRKKGTNLSTLQKYVEAKAILAGINLFN